MVPFHRFQVQKLFFLLDMNIAKQTAGPHFTFEPYDYGPFDKQVYLELKKMRDDRLVENLRGEPVRNKNISTDE